MATKTVKTSKKSTDKKVVETKKVEEAVKAEPKKEEAKVASKKTAPAKKTTTKKEAVKAEPKKEEAKVASKKAAPVKKTATKKEAVKAEPKKEEVKAASKKAAPAKKTTKKETVKAEPKKEETKTDSKKAVKAAPKKKAPAKKAAPKKTTTKKTVTKKMTKEEQYNNLSIDTCLDLAKAMSSEITRDSIIQQLILNPDVQSVSKHIVNKYQLKDKFKFEEDGYDSDLIEVLVSKVYETAEIKPEKAEDLQADVNHALNYTYTDIVADGEEYKAQFDTMRKVLMIAQHKDIHDSKVLDDEIGIDAEKFIVEFMDLAYKVLKSWKYEDVDYYEHFIYAVLSQLEDLHDTYRNRIMMDVADLYILHGDYGLGDADYGYILRENQIKDYIYYRYASIYEGVDKDKAKQIAHQALQFVDDRFTYYPNILAVLEG